MRARTSSGCQPWISERPQRSRTSRSRSQITQATTRPGRCRTPARPGQRRPPPPPTGWRCPCPRPCWHRHQCHALLAGSSHRLRICRLPRRWQGVGAQRQGSISDEEPENRRSHETGDIDNLRRESISPAARMDTPPPRIRSPACRSPAPSPSLSRPSSHERRRRSGCRPTPVQRRRANCAHCTSLNRRSRRLQPSPPT